MLKRIALLSLASLALFATTAQAYSVRVHIYLANSIIDELERSMESQGKPFLRLVQPGSKTPTAVEINDIDARAILEFPEYFRGGSLGPDNTVAPGLTDPSHAPINMPFKQCTGLYNAAIEREEMAREAGTDVELSNRAYALGCFLHGISDNAAHHVVNLFTGQTFTLYPVDQVSEGDPLKFSMINVIRHIVTETHFEKGVFSADEFLAPEERELPGVTATPATDAMNKRLRTDHKIAADLVIDLYYRRDLRENEHSQWNHLAESLYQSKVKALTDALGIDDKLQLRDYLLQKPTESDSDGPFTKDIKLVEAYLDFLQNLDEGFEQALIAQGVIAEPFTKHDSTTSLEPAQLILMLPIIVDDAKFFLEVIEEQGVTELQELYSVTTQDDSCPLLNARCAMMRNAFALNPETRVSRFHEQRLQKNEAFDKVMVTYLKTVEGLSNLNVGSGIQHASSEEIDAAFAPISALTAELTEFDMAILFGDTIAKVLEIVGKVVESITGVFSLIKEKIVDLIIVAVKGFYKALTSDFLAWTADHIEWLSKELADKLREWQVIVNDAKAAAKDGAEAAALEALALQLEAGESAFDNFLGSVLWMNTYNSVAGTLAYHDAADPSIYASGRFAGPTSFDASYQLEYNQLYQCNKDVFYPCGTSSGEMLQADKDSCTQISNTDAILNPPVECHADSPSTYASASVDSCKEAPLHDHTVEQGLSHYGSYTLSYPPSEQTLGDLAPTCYGSFPVATDEDGDGKFDRIKGGDLDDDGCSCAAGKDSAFSTLWLILVVGLLRRRRRA